MKRIILPSVYLLLIIAMTACSTKSRKLSDIRKIGPQPDGSIFVPSNQLLKPAGFQAYFPGRPVDLVVTKDGRFLVIKNNGDLTLVRISDRKIMQSLPYRKSGASFTGITLSPDGKQVYVTDAEDNLCIAGFDDNNLLSWLDPVVLPNPAAGGFAVPGGIALDEAGRKAYVTLSRNNSLAVIDLAKKKTSEIPVGMAPYDVVLLSDSKAYVTNWGGRVPGPGESTGNSSGSMILTDPVNHIANSGTVSVVDLATGKQVKVIETGLHPGEMVFSPDRKTLYVTCANSDIVCAINTATDEITEKISVHGSDDLPFGSGPDGLATSPDGKILYVANGTENAICVIETGSPSKILGFIPTGWFPGSLATDRAGRNLYAVNIKGIGSRNQRTGRKGFNSYDYQGSVSIIPVPGEKALASFTETVHQNNSWSRMTAQLHPEGKSKGTVPVPEIPGQASPIKHVVYIIKENRTYDQVFGDMPQGDGDTNLVEFGREVTPNHHLLAETFVLLDNFYCSGVLSADGHQWTDEAYVTDYLERSFGDFNRSYPYDGDDALAYASSGFIWDNVLKHGLTFRNYGEFVNAVIEPSNATFSEIWQDYINGSGKIKISGKPNIETIAPYLCTDYISFPSIVSDQYRADVFIRELKEYENKGDFPAFIIMALPNDHTSGTQPGMPVPQASVADNDLALGRIVDAISHSKFWNETCILVTEDDPQAGLDHVDGHRTVGMVISPYTKRGETVSTYYSQINMVRTIENILGLPPMNQLDLTAEPMSDCFTAKPDFTPYNSVKNNIPLDRLNPPLSSLTGDELYWAKKSMEQDLTEVDRIDEDTFNRIIWHAVKGYDRAYPVIEDRMD